MHWSPFVLLLGAVAGTHAHPSDSAVDTARLPPPLPRCGINEHFESNSNKCQITCDNMRYEAVMGAYAATSDCYCNKGYVRNDEGTCIKREDCPPPRCPKGETWNICGSACPPTCANRDNTCLVCTLQCVSGCFCAEGTVRAPDGSCVKPENCPPRTCFGPNEVFVKCPSTCPRTENCENLWSKESCTPIDCCDPKCRCKPGYYRNDKNTCVTAKQCTNNHCSDPNAERVECALATQCRPSCAVPNPGPCFSQICIKNECICKKGYILSEKGGKCVTADQCPIQKSCNGDPNAQIKECPLACPATCDVPNAIPCRKACVPIGCECKDGYILSESNGKCILAEKCKGGYPCGRNETFVSCKVPCPSDYCPVGNSPNTVICETPNPCYPGCVCKFNYRRKSVNDRRCIYASECPPQKCNKNEEWSRCPSECLQEDCSNKNDAKVICNTLLLNCQPKCICKRGYYRDSNRDCVPASQCPKPIKCKDNEVYRTCRIICPPQTCASIYTSYDCRDANKRCEPGCDCINEYLRNGTENDPCIPSSQCPTSPPVTPECGINEHYETNRNKCELTCKNYELESVMGPCQATSGCFCDTGYVKNSNGLCILKKNCPKPIKCKDNEVYRTCRIICPPQTCASIYRSYDCSDANKRCEPGCDCINEYLRNGTENDPCIPSSQCPTTPPVTPECGINEHYETNRKKCELTCKNYEKESILGPCQTTSGCFCDTGYVKNSNGLCILKKNCPKNIVCPPNEVVSECYNSCHKTCKTRLRSDGRMCQLACIETGCLCKEGYLRHDNGTCVPINECSPPRCDENETYSACGTACPPTCQNRGDNCTGCNDQCVEDCFCNKGLVRAEDGCCIKPKYCPKRTCKDPNEVFDECPPTCPPTDGCSNIWSKFKCTNAVKCCKPQCRCRPGYYRKDVCVPVNQC